MRLICRVRAALVRKGEVAKWSPLACSTPAAGSSSSRVLQATMQQSNIQIARSARSRSARTSSFRALAGVPSWVRKSRPTAASGTRPGEPMVAEDLLTRGRCRYNLAGATLPGVLAAELQAGDGRMLLNSIAVSLPARKHR
jgi:hypothetical protein